MSGTQIEMPFGKNKRLAMPKANKKKVPAREEMPEIGNEAGVNGAEVLPPAPAPTEEPQAPSPGRLKRKQAKDECEELYMEYEAYRELDCEAEKELTMRTHLYGAKMRRIDASQAGKRHGCPFKELERIYNAELEFTQAKLKREILGSNANNAEANWLAQQCMLLRLENAKMRRLLRAHHVRM